MHLSRIVLRATAARDKTQNTCKRVVQEVKLSCFTFTPQAFLRHRKLRPRNKCLGTCSVTQGLLMIKHLKAFGSAPVY